MGLERYLLASSLNLIIAQRLVRKICDKCKEPIEINESVLSKLKITPEQAKNSTFYHGKGCTACGGTGYLGRLPIFEFLMMDTDIRRKIVDGGTEADIRAMSHEKGYGSLLDSGVGRMLDGLTTAEEVLRVTFADNNNHS